MRCQHRAGCKNKAIFLLQPSISTRPTKPHPGQREKDQQASINQNVCIRKHSFGAGEAVQGYCANIRDRAGGSVFYPSFIRPASQGLWNRFLPNCSFPVLIPILRPMPYPLPPHAELSGCLITPCPHGGLFIWLRHNPWFVGGGGMLDYWQRKTAGPKHKCPMTKSDM